MTDVSSTPDRRQTLLDSYRAAGQPMATVYLPTRSDAADASDRFEIEIKNCVSRLSELGAGPGMIATVESALSGFGHDDGTAVVVVATEEKVVLSHSMFRPLTRPLSSLGPTPALLPLLEATQADLPHVAVLLDRVGADVWYRTDLGAAVETASIEGDDRHVHRGHPGGWSQRRFQQIAENTWEDNARTVVSAVLDDLPETEIVVAGGDVRAVGFFAQHLPEHLGRLVTVDGSRAAGPEAFLDNADVAIRSVAAERLVTAIGDCRDAIGEGRAVEGADALRLLGQGRIERLFVADDTTIDPRPTVRVDFSIPVVTDVGGIDCAITDAAVHLAVLTGAEVTVLPKAVLDRSVAGSVRGSLSSATSP